MRILRLIIGFFFPLLLISACGTPPAVPTATRTAESPAFIAPATATVPAPAPIATMDNSTVSPTLAAPTSPITPPSSVTPSSVPSAGFDTARALDNVRTLSVTIGKRVAGTPGGAKAADYIAAQFADAGLQVQRQAFEFDGWEDRGTRVEMTAPEALDLQGLALQYSPSGQVEAPLVAVDGIGRDSDYTGLDVKGKIVLVQRGTTFLSDKARAAEKAGAAGVIIYNNSPEAYTGTLRDRVNIPAMAVSGNEGKQLLDLLRQGAVTVRITSNTYTGRFTGQNIIGVRSGNQPDTIVLGAHYDSVSAGPGANDNGSGTGVLIELAHVLGGQPHNKTLVFVAFDAEELGLLGSRHYVEQLSTQDRNRIRRMLNFDMLGGGSGPLLLGGEGQIAQRARSVAKELGITAQNFQLGGGAGSDHESFQSMGADTVFFSRDYNLLHTPQDTIDQVQQKYLDEAGRVAQRLTQMLDSE